MLSRIHVGALVFAGALACSQAAVASPAVQLTGGATSVRLSQELLGALGSLGVVPDNVLPGGLHPTSQGATVVFPIPTGELDAQGPVLEIIHSGGLTLTAGDTRVALTSFIIENIGNDLRLSGVVKANDTIVGRIPLFRIALTQAPEVTPGAGSGAGRLKVEGAELTLTRPRGSDVERRFRARRRLQGGLPDRHGAHHGPHPRPRRLNRSTVCRRPAVPSLSPSRILPAALLYTAACSMP